MPSGRLGGKHLQTFQVTIRYLQGLIRIYLPSAPTQQLKNRQTLPGRGRWIDKFTSAAPFSNTADSRCRGGGRGIQSSPAVSAPQPKNPLENQPTYLPTYL